ncbi:MAG: hypothetical protein DDT22_00897 [candidate division WS2 bacterium]|nr:hypothetical protein [Candidatus Lithacetigena glycinireducens]
MSVVGSEALNDWLREQKKKEEFQEKHPGETPIDIRDMRNGDWFWIHKIVIEKYGQVIGAYGIALYNAICYFANNRTQRAYPSAETIAQKIGCDKRTVLEYLEKLENAKLIEVERKPGMVNIYKLIKPK